MFNEWDRRCVVVQPCSLPIQVMTTGPLPAPSKCKSGRFNAWGYSSTHHMTVWRWWSGRPHHAISHLRSRLESQHLSVPGGAEECGDALVQAGGWWQDTAPPHKLKATQAWLQKECYDFVPFSHWLPSSPDPNPLEDITNITSHSTKASLIAAIRRVFTELPLAFVEKACSQFRIRIEAVI